MTSPNGSKLPRVLIHQVLFHARSILSWATEIAIEPTPGLGAIPICNNLSAVEITYCVQLSFLPSVGVEPVSWTLQIQTFQLGSRVQQQREAGGSIQEHRRKGWGTGVPR
jgi:hypothetical protein